MLTFVLYLLSRTSFLINLAEMLLMLTLSMHFNLSLSLYPRDRISRSALWGLLIFIQITNNRLVMSLRCCCSSSVDYQSNMDGNGKCLHHRGDDNNRMCKYELILQHQHHFPRQPTKQQTDVRSVGSVFLTRHRAAFLSFSSPVIIICSTSSSNQH